MYDILWERRAFEFKYSFFHCFHNFQGCANKHFMLWINPVWTKINAFLDVEKIHQFAGLIRIARILNEINDAYFHHFILYHSNSASKLEILFFTQFVNFKELLLLYYSSVSNIKGRILRFLCAKPLNM